MICSEKFQPLLFTNADIIHSVGKSNSRVGYYRCIFLSTDFQIRTQEAGRLGKGICHVEINLEMASGMQQTRGTKKKGFTFSQQLNIDELAGASISWDSYFSGLP